MKTRTTAATAGAALATAGIVIGVTVLGGQSPNSSNIEQDRKTTAPAREAAPAAAPAVDEILGLPGDVLCALSAVPDLTGVDPRIAESAAVNLVSQPLETGAQAISRETIAEHARTLSTATEEISGTAAAAAVSVPYSLAGLWFGDSNQLIAADRCVWVVTVEAPYTPPRRLRGSPVRSFDRYTAIFDRASGEYIGLTAGPGLPDVLAGLNVTVPEE